METLTGRTVLVTGASRGIGLAVSEAARAAGADVLMIARGERLLREAAARLGAGALVCDVASVESVGSLREQVEKMIGGVPHALVNAAGTFAIAPFAETDPDLFDVQIAANLRGPFLVTRALLPGMVERGSGHIVNVGSVAGRHAFPGNAAYAASKFGLRGMHEVLAAELRGTGVRATLVEPAATDTSLWDALSPETRDDLPSRSQMLTPSDVARGIVFALSQPAGVEVTHLAVRSTA